MSLDPMTTTQAPEGVALLPCPFCGGKAKREQRNDPGPPDVFCANVSTCGGYAETVEAWNRRVPVNGQGSGPFSPESENPYRATGPSVVALKPLVEWLLAEITRPFPVATGIDSSERDMARAKSVGHRDGLKACLAWLEDRQDQQAPISDDTQGTNERSEGMGHDWREGDCFECLAPLVGPFCPECNPAIKQALGYAVDHDLEALREKVAAAHWESERADALADCEHDYGPWPPTAGFFGWQEDDAEDVREKRRRAADAILSTLLSKSGEA